jgi:hypothetical protein
LPELSPSAEREATAKPSRVPEVIPATGVILVWIVLLIGAPRTALLSVWLLLLGLSLGAWALLMRLRYSSQCLALTIGPWRREVDLGRLESVTWKKTGGGRSRGTIFVRDQSGQTVPIYFGRFRDRERWGPLLVRAGDASDAPMDRHSRAYLEGRMPEGASVH